MKNLVTTCLLILAATGVVFPAGERTAAGGRAAAMGGTSVANSDLWSLFNNPAGLAWLEHPLAGACFENHFLARQLMYEFLGGVLPFKGGVIGLLGSRYGNEQYNEFKAGICYAKKFGKHFSAGTQINYTRIHLTDNYGNKNIVSCEIGLLFQATRQITIGVQLVNPVPVKITMHPAEHLPATICTGLLCRFSNSFHMTVEAEKDTEHPVSLRAGAEYLVARPAKVRVGISTSPMSFTFGFGIETGRLTIDISSGYHQALGFSPAGSLSYSFR